jgi:hypothetical protein
MAPAAALQRTAWAEAKCDPPCTECEKCVTKTCKPVPEGRKCRRGFCRGGICRAGASECSVSDGGAVSIDTAAEFRDDTLRVVQTTQPFDDDGNTKGTLDVTFAGDPVVSIATESAGGTVKVTVKYGDAFRGIKLSHFTNNGTTITGDIDGRAIVPLPVGADPNRATFQDGAPPPTIKVNPDLVDGVAAVLRQAEQGAAECTPSAARGLTTERHAKGLHHKRSHHKRAHGKGSSGKPLHASDHPEDSLGCLALYVPCTLEDTDCVAAAASGCTITLFGYGICVAIALGLCALKAEKCRRKIRHNAPCCPVRCGGDPENSLFGSDPGCCEEGESCLDPGSSTSFCCPPGRTGCGGECCPNGACIQGSCCAPPNGSVCGGQCCQGAFSRCCGGNTCCTGTCIGGTCCPSPNFDCGGFCCQGGNACCNNRCCAPNQVCDPTTHNCRDADPCPKRCDNGECCEEGRVCCGGASGGQSCVDVCVH